MSLWVLIEMSENYNNMQLLFIRVLSETHYELMWVLDRDVE